MVGMNESSKDTTRTGQDPASQTSWQLAFAYDQREDRLLLTVATGIIGPDGRIEPQQAHDVLVTRRLAGRLIDGFASLLERTSAVAAKAPADMREDIILLEHQGAIAPGKPRAESAAPDPDQDQDQDHDRVPPARQFSGLLDAIDIGIRPTSFELALKTGGTVVTHFAVTRVELHRILEILSRHAENAGWNLTPQASWMAPGETSITLN
jgi:hypothetical protein